MADKRIQQYPEKTSPSSSDYLLLADNQDVDVNGFLKYKKIKLSSLDNIVITNAEDILLLDLLDLLTNNNLVIGRFYRITDSQVGEPIIVQAVALNMLSEIGISGIDGKVYKYDINTDAISSFPSLNDFVPYSGATNNVDLGEYQAKVGQLELDQTPSGTFGVAKMRWNDTDGTAEILLKGGNVTLQIGQEQLARVVNKTNTNLTEAGYQVVRISGAQGQRLKVGLAQANSTSTCKDTLGLVTENISNNAEGFITTSGIVRGINTTGALQGETWVDGDRLYLSPSVAGGITKIEPSAPNIVIVLGYVVYAHASQGSIYVSVEGAKALHELFDVSIPNPTNNNILVYESATNLWKDKAISTLITGTTNQVNVTPTISGVTLSLPQSIATNSDVQFNMVTSNSFVKVGGTSSQFLKADGSIDPTGYIAGFTLAGEVSGSGSTFVNVTLNNNAVTGKVLTGLSVSGSAVVSTDSMLTAFGKLQNQINAVLGSVNFQGVWNASTNSPSLASGVGTKGYYYVVTVAGSTDLDGITDWKLGDWAIFNGSAWQKVDNTDAVVSVNGYMGIVTLSASDVGALPTSAISGTTGKLAKFGSSSSVVDSIMSESGGVIDIAGKLNLSGTSGELLTINGVAGEWGANIKGNSLTNNSYGLLISAGTSVSDFALGVFNQSLSSSLFLIRGNGQLITAGAANTGEHFIVGGSLRANGNVGQNATLSNWTSLNNVNALQNKGGALYNYELDSIILGQNIYISTALGNTYVATGAATTYVQSAGVHVWQTAASGTANTAATLTTRMTLSATELITFGATDTGEAHIFGGSARVNGTISAYNSPSYQGAFLQGANGISYFGSLGTDDIEFYTGGTTKMIIKQSTGNVGIGTTSPVYKVQIVESGNALLQLNGNNTTGALDTGFTISADDSKNIFLYQRETADLYIGTNNTTRLTIASTGAATFSSSVTTNGQLTVNNTVAKIDGSDALLSLTGDTKEWRLQTVDSNGRLRFYNETDGIEALQLASTGAATFSSSVSAKTQGVSTNFNTGSFIARSNSSDIKYAQLGYDATGDYGWIQCIHQGTAYTNLVLNAGGGNVGVGIESPSEKLEVQNGTAGARIKASNTGGGSISFGISSNATSVADITFTNALSLIGGNVGIGTTSPVWKLHVAEPSGADRLLFAAQISGASNGFNVRWVNSTAKTVVNITDIPTSASGLSSGDIWNDGGTLKIV